MTDTAALSPHGVLAPNEMPGGARCAVHADRTASVTCTRCGNFACHECETRGDSGSVVCRACESAGDGEPIPWEKRSEIGFVRAFLQTTFAVLVRPWDFFALRPREASILPAVVYGWMLTVPASILGTLSNLLTLDAQRALYLANPVLRDFLWVFDLPFQLGVGLSGIVLFPLVLGFYSVLWQLTLMPFGTAQRPLRPIKETARALGYLHAIYVPTLVLGPMMAIMTALGLQALGGLLGLPLIAYTWSMSAIAMWKTHRVDGWRVFAAVGLQLATLLTFSCLIAGLAVFAAVSLMPGGFPR